jgi:hypothetical protein
MSRMSEYCKAYPVQRFREYPGWTEDLTALQPLDLDGEPARDPAPRTLGEDDVLFLHDNYHVTDGIFVDEHIVFSADTPEWRQFCQGVLGFELPEYLRDEAPIEQVEPVESVPASVSSAASSA